MDKAVPYAVGYGIEESTLWTMTPAEIIRAIKAKTRNERAVLHFVDLHLSRLLAYYASAHGVKHAAPADYSILPQLQEDEEVVEDEPESGTQSIEQQAFMLKLFAAIEQKEQKRRNAHHG